MQVIMRQINDHLNINRNTSNSFPHIIDGFCLQAEEIKKKQIFAFILILKL